MSGYSAVRGELRSSPKLFRRLDAAQLVKHAYGLVTEARRMEITLSKWSFEGVMDKRNVLAISPLYFEITSGLGKWLYRASRKHGGGNGAEGFKIGFETLHQKSGSESSLPSFKNKILELACANNLPEINLEVIAAETPRPKLTMVMRKYLDGQPANDAEAPPLPSFPRAALSSSMFQTPPAGRARTASKTPSPSAREFVDPHLRRGLLSRTAASLKFEDSDPADPHAKIYAETANAAPQPSLGLGR